MALLEVEHLDVTYATKHRSPLSSDRISPNTATESALAVTSAAALNATRFIVLVHERFGVLPNPAARMRRNG